jgi:ethanolamine utilization protein EutQ (cupin superfamily)
MQVRKFALNDIPLERSPGQNADIFVGNAVDQRDGAPITIGDGRYAPDLRRVMTSERGSASSGR